MKFGSLRGRIFAFVLLFFASVVQCAVALAPREYAIQISADINDNPRAVVLNWESVSEAAQIQVAKKQKNSTTWSSLATLPGSATNYTDFNVAPGNSYEYAVTVPNAPFARSGYIFVGVDAPLVDYRGKVLLVVEETHANYLSLELAQLQQNLVGDGWIVVRRTVSRNDSPAEVRAIIQGARQSDSAIRSVFLFGRVPVPYSGNYEADDHPDHKGAWAADTF